MPHILVIEDEEQERTRLQQLLNDAGFEVSNAINGLEGVRLFKENTPDLVITDIVMPQQEGIETIQQIVSLAPEAKIIAISEMARADYLAIAKDMGAKYTLPKPIDKEDLLAAVEALL